jgi:NADH:ubiquinone oxidoreductase subunit 4 (subunit M)
MDLLTVVQLEHVVKEMLEEMLPHALVEAEVVLLVQVLQEQVHPVQLREVLEVLDQLQIFQEAVLHTLVVAEVMV